MEESRRSDPDPYESETFRLLSTSPLVLPPDPPDPEAGWARSNPARAMAFLYVSPRDCDALTELLEI